MRRQNLMKYCILCDSITIFKYNIKLSHSKCEKCGSPNFSDVVSIETNQFKEKCRKAWKKFDETNKDPKINPRKPLWLQREEREIKEIKK